MAFTPHPLTSTSFNRIASGEYFALLATDSPQVFVSCSLSLVQLVTAMGDLPRRYIAACPLEKDSETLCTGWHRLRIQTAENHLLCRGPAAGTPVDPNRWVRLSRNPQSPSVSSSRPGAIRCIEICQGVQHTGLEEDAVLQRLLRGSGFCIGAPPRIDRSTVSNQLVPKTSWYLGKRGWCSTRRILVGRVHGQLEEAPGQQCLSRFHQD